MTSTEYRCQACGQWLLTTRPTGEWVRTRCSNRRCLKYGQNQTIRLDPDERKPALLQTAQL